MQTIGPYRLREVLGRCDVGVVWSAVNAEGVPATLAVLDASTAQDENWRRAFALTTEALSQADQDRLPVLQADFTGPTPWVACTPESGLGPARIFVALGIPFHPWDSSRAELVPRPPVAPVPVAVAPAPLDVLVGEPQAVRSKRSRAWLWVAVGMLLLAIPPAAVGAVLALGESRGNGPGTDTTNPPAASHVPGTFVVSQKIIVPGSAPSDERQRVRLAVYSFRTPSQDPTFMTFRMDTWTWNTTESDSDTIADCETGSVIGRAIDGSEPNAADANKAPQCPQRGLEEPTQRFGTYCGPRGNEPNVILPGDEFTIFWHDTEGNSTPGCHGNDLERWRYSPDAMDADKLAMLEMLESSDADPRYAFYAASTPYDPDALSVGWGFGARTTLGPKGGRTMREIAGQILEGGTIFDGYWKSWNNWCAAPDQRNESVRRVSTAAQAYPWKETDGTVNGESSPKLRIRDRGRTATQTHDVFIYMSVPDNQQSSFTNRRINLSSGNDYDDNGHIADNFGHTQSGLQVINADGQMVGFVTVEVGHGDKEPRGRDTLSALYYIRSDLTPDDPTGAVRC